MPACLPACFSTPQPPPADPTRPYTPLPPQVAVLAYTGFDMEDAMILNKSAMERGLAHGSMYKVGRWRWCCWAAGGGC